MGCSVCSDCSALMSFWQSDLNFQAKAIEALQHASEDYLVHLFEDVSLFGALLAYCVRLL